MCGCVEFLVLHLEHVLLHLLCIGYWLLTHSFVVAFYVSLLILFGSLLCNVMFFCLKLETFDWICNIPYCNVLVIELK